MSMIALGVAAGLYLALVAALYLGQRALQYPADTTARSVAEAGLVGFHDVVLLTPDGERLTAWWRPPEPGRALLLYFQGNAQALWARRYRARALTEDGRGLLLVSYRGYGGSTGSPSEEGLATDARTARDWLRSYAPDRIVLYGESLGTGVAIRLATERPVAGLILDAPYSSAADVAQTRYPFVPVAWFMRDQYRSIDRIGAVRVPLLMMHGEQDSVIPIAQSERLFAAANEPKTYLRFPGAGHSELLEKGGLEAVHRFLGAIEETMAR